MFYFNKNEIWTLQKAASLMMCLYRKQRFLFNGDYYQEQIKLLGVYGLEIMGMAGKLMVVESVQMCTNKALDLGLTHSCAITEI